MPYERLGLEPIRRLLERLGDPQRGLRVIHVAGSKGKGSTALFVEAICRAAGERVGTFTSPHLERWTERFRLDGREVAGERLAAAVARLRPHVDALRAAGRASAPTFFDATTAAALLLFEEARVDRVVLEVGLGGRLDSTNVVDPVVSCVTSIELEHTDKLGTSLAEIAYEKAGILKPGVPAVAGDLPAPARAVLSDRARERRHRGRVAGHATSTSRSGAGDRRGSRCGFATARWRSMLKLPVLGVHQAANAALALACARRSRVASDADLADAAARGSRGGRAPGPHRDARALAVAARRRRPHRRVRAGPRARPRLASPPPHPARAVDLRRQGHVVDPRGAAPGGGRGDRDAGRAGALAGARGGRQRRAGGRPGAGRCASCRTRSWRCGPRASGLAADDLLCVSGSVYLAGIARRVLRERPRRRASRVPARRRGRRMASRDPAAEAAFRTEVRGNLRRNYLAHLAHGLLGQTGMRLINAPTFVPYYISSPGRLRRGGRHRAGPAVPGHVPLAGARRHHHRAPAPRAAGGLRHRRADARAGARTRARRGCCFRPRGRSSPLGSFSRCSGSSSGSRASSSTSSSRR